MTGECSDGARDGVGGVVADDAAAAGTVLLVGDVHGGSCGCGESGQVCGVGYDGMVGCIEGYVTYSELLGASAVLAAVTGVFADME